MSNKDLKIYKGFGPAALVKESVIIVAAYSREKAEKIVREKLQNNVNPSPKDMYVYVEQVQIEDGTIIFEDFGNEPI